MELVSAIKLGSLGKSMSFPSNCYLFGWVFSSPLPYLLCYSILRTWLETDQVSLLRYPSHSDQQTRELSQVEYRRELNS